MTNVHVNAGRLGLDQLLVRAAALLAIATAGLILGVVDPQSLSWLPFRTSCAAATGLPCIFCGATRALHSLLNGELSQALYFNWLAFPVAAFALVAAVKSGAELVLRRRWQVRLPAFRFTPRIAALGTLVLFALWIFQVSLALVFHKRALLNSDGPLYGLVSAWL